MIWKSTFRNSLTLIAMLFFFASCVIAQPAVPTPILPPCGSTIFHNVGSPLIITFAWSPSPGARSYRLQVQSGQPSIPWPIVDITTVSNSVSVVFPPSAALILGTYNYYWRVNASDTVGTSPWSRQCFFYLVIRDIYPPSIHTLLGTDKSSYVPGDSVKIFFSLSNVGRDTIHLNFSSSQQYDFTATTSGSLVWRWSYGKVFLPIMLPGRLAPGQTITYRESWNQQSNSGQQVPSGSYIIQGILTIIPPPLVPSASTVITISPPTDVHDEELLPREFILHQNYPNPFNPSTKIKFALPEKANVKLSIYNLLGEKVAELVNGELTAGYHEVEFLAKAIPSGVYFYELHAGAFREVKKMILLK